VGFGLTTLALVGLASTGTGLLVAHGTSQLQPPVQHVVPPVPSPPALTPVVVDRAPGTFRPPVRVVTPVSLPDPGRGAVLPPPPAVAEPPAVGPVVLPPVVLPPVAPPVVEPPVLPPGPVLSPDTDGGKKKPHPAHPDDRGKHLGQLKH
jgi:hypothetical protein